MFNYVKKKYNKPDTYYKATLGEFVKKTFKLDSEKEHICELVNVLGQLFYPKDYEQIKNIEEF